MGCLCAASRWLDVFYAGGYQAPQIPDATGVVEQVIQFFGPGPGGGNLFVDDLACAQPAKGSQADPELSGKAGLRAGQSG